MPTQTHIQACTRHWQRSRQRNGTMKKPRNVSAQHAAIDWRERRSCRKWTEKKKDKHFGLAVTVLLLLRIYCSLIDVRHFRSFLIELFHFSLFLCSIRNERKYVVTKTWWRLKSTNSNDEKTAVFFQFWSRDLCLFLWNIRNIAEHWLGAFYVQHSMPRCEWPKSQCVCVQVSVFDQRHVTVNVCICFFIQFYFESGN